MKQLDEQDASFLYLETPETPMHVGGLNILELPADFAGDFFENYKRHIGERVHLVPTLHRKLLPLPFDIDHPLWVEEPQVDLDYHVRHLSLPKPGQWRQLEELVGRVHSNFLDRSRPLWEFYVIDGLEDGRVAIYTKIHHAAMDGTASQLLASVMHDVTPVPRPVAPPVARTAEKVDAATISKAISTHFLRQEIRAIQFVPELLKTWAHLALPNADTLRYEGSVRPPPQTPKTLFNVAISSQRSYAARTLPMGPAKAIAKAAGAKLNDVVLAIASGALRRYLEEKHVLPHRSMTAMVPVSLREAGDQEMNNQNAIMICSLASDVADPAARLEVIRQSSQEQKQLIRNVRNILLPDLSVIGGGILMRGLIDLYSRAKLADRIPPLGNLTVSNVPGPPVPLYIAGARVRTFYPCSIPNHGNAINITVQSYCDNMDFGFTACRRTVPDVTQLADHLAPALEELAAAVLAKPATAAAAPPLAEPAARRPARKRKPAPRRAAAPTPSGGGGPAAG